jgi:hypothetical protein
MAAITGQQIQQTPPPNWGDIGRRLGRLGARLVALGLGAGAAYIGHRYGLYVGTAAGTAAAAIAHEVTPLLTGGEVIEPTSLPSDK